RDLGDEKLVVRGTGRLSRRRLWSPVLRVNAGARSGPILSIRLPGQGDHKGRQRVVPCVGTNPRLSLFTAPRSLHIGGSERLERLPIGWNITPLGLRSMRLWYLLTLTRRHEIR